MTRIPFRLLALSALLVLTGCATINGLGQDVEATGRVIQRAV